MKSCGSGSNGQPFSSLGAPSFQDQPPALGAHAEPESVGSLSGNIAWLVGPLQNSSSWSKSPFYGIGEQVSSSLADPDLFIPSTKTAHINNQAGMGFEAMGL